MVIDIDDIKRLDAIDNYPRIISCDNLLDFCYTTVYKKKDLVNLFISVKSLKKDGTTIPDVEQFTVKMTLKQMEQLYKELEKKMKKYLSD